MTFTGLQAESRTSTVVAVLEDDFANPFDIALCYINLSSGSEMETQR